MKIETLKDLFTSELSDILDSEKRVCKALEKMAECCTDQALAEYFREDAAQAKQQTEEIEKVFDALALERPGETCEATQGLVEEAEEFIDNVETGRVLDAALITSAQKFKHYEIAGYGSLCCIANCLGYTEQAGALNKCLDQEKQADEKLTELAKGGINEEAAKIAA